MALFLKNLDRWAQTVLRWLCLVIFFALGLILLANVVLRVGNDIVRFLEIREYAGLASAAKAVVPTVSMHWFDEIVELCFASLVFYGAAALWGIKGHFSVGDWISPRLPWPRAHSFYRLAVSAISACFIAVFFYYSLRLTVRTTELSTVFQIPKSVMYSCMPASSAIMLAYSLVDMILDGRKLLFPYTDAAGSKTQRSQSM